ncbi:MAG TPA: virulence factor SrfC family protein, partial [Methylocella sp.]|nr:virulence factor SrfC family protein [Methylocella sp.]
FGTFLRGLSIDRARLVDEFYEARTRGTLFDAQGETPAQAPSTSPSPRRGNLLDLVKSNSKETATASAPVAKAPLSSNRFNRTVGLARAALQLWSQSIHEICDDEMFANAIGVPKKSLKEVANELIATARRLGLENAIKSSIVAVSHIETSEQAAAKATIIAERSINRFVAFMGVSTAAHPAAFDTEGITDQPVNFQQEFVVGWLRAFYDQVLANARSCDGLIHDAEQNARLGQILSAIGQGESRQ